MIFGAKLEYMSEIYIRHFKFKCFFLHFIVFSELLFG